MVLGTDEEPQGGISATTESTVGLVTVEGSTIAFAHEAITNKSPFFGFWEGYPGPGTIQVTNSNLYNNYVSISIENPYHLRSHLIEDCLFTQSTSFVNHYEVPFNGVDYYEYCAYEVAAPYQLVNAEWSWFPTLLGGSPDQFQVVVRHSNDFTIEGNRFESQSQSTSPFGGGIKVMNSGLTIGPDNAELEDPRGNMFFRLAHAIDSYGYNDCLSNVRVQGNMFVNNVRSVTLNANPMSVLERNLFRARVGDGVEIPYLPENNSPTSPEYFVFANESFVPIMLLKVL